MWVQGQIIGAKEGALQEVTDLLCSVVWRPDGTLKILASCWVSWEKHELPQISSCVSECRNTLAVGNEVPGVLPGLMMAPPCKAEATSASELSFLPCVIAVSEIKRSRARQCHLLGKLGQALYLLLQGHRSVTVIAIIKAHCNGGKITGRGLSHQIAVENRCSPLHLLSKWRHSRCKTALKWYHGCKYSS